MDGDGQPAAGSRHRRCRDSTRAPAPGGAGAGYPAPGPAGTATRSAHAARAAASRASSPTVSRCSRDSRTRSSPGSRIREHPAGTARRGRSLRRHSPAAPSAGAAPSAAAGPTPHPPSPGALAAVPGGTLAISAAVRARTVSGRAGPSRSLRLRGSPVIPRAGLRARAASTGCPAGEESVRGPSVRSRRPAAASRPLSVSSAAAFAHRPDRSRRAARPPAPARRTGPAGPGGGGATSVA